ncbi:MAG: hypothetical protein AAF288_13955 [Planctomycetota bacterium]
MRSVPRPDRRKLARARRGTAMSETLLVLPFLLVIFSLMFFLGLNLKRLERATMLGGYEARRQAVVGEGPGGTLATERTAFGELFFESQERLDVEVLDQDDFPLAEDLEDAWRTAVAAAPSESGADDLLTQYLDRVPAGRSVRVRLNTDDRIPLWSELTDPVLEHRTAMVGSQWRFADAVGEEANPFGGVYRTQADLEFGSRRDLFAARLLGDAWLDQYAPGFRDAVQPMADAGNLYAAAVMNWMLGSPSYAGPNLPTQ